MLPQRFQISHVEMGGQDEKARKCRSKLVCREIKRAKDRDEQLGPEDVFSPLPPSEGLKMPVSTMMTGHDDGNHGDGPFEMATWDVSRAHFYGEARRWIYTYLPAGLEHKGKLARLCRSMYGTRDAASIWGDTWSEVSTEISKDCVMVTTSALWHDGNSCKHLVKVLQKRFEVKQTGHIGFGADDKKELKILNRTIKFDVLNDEMTLEADTKLVEGALESMKFDWCKRRRFATCQEELRSKRHRSRIPRNSRQRSRLCTAVW